MTTLELGNIELDLDKLDNMIREYIPSGMNVHESPIDGADSYINELICKDELKNKDNWLEKSLGTLGGGNHFIEIDVDDENNKYLVIHTGSRNLGKQVAEIYQEKAIKYCSYEKEMNDEKRKIIKEYKEQHREKEIQNKLIEISEKYKGKTKLPKDLCYLEGDLRDDYLHDMKICQDFAVENRTNIAFKIINTICSQFTFPKFFETVHNYISFEDNIVRKGAISAKKGEKVLIPMNMRDGCIIGIGKGNDDWNCSAPHGAGRIMSRMDAKKTLNLESYKDSMQNIYSTCVNESTIDESPMVYKPMDEIINNIKDTVDIVKIIKPIYNFKASE